MLQSIVYSSQLVTSNLMIYNERIVNSLRTAVRNWNERGADNVNASLYLVRESFRAETEVDKGNHVLRHLDVNPVWTKRTF